MIYPAKSFADRRGEAARDGYVSFRVAGQWLGIPVVLVQEVLTEQSISRVPLAPPEVSGFLNLRGQIVTALDLRTRLGLPAREPGASFMNIVVRDEGELFSLLVDAVGDVVEVSGEQVEPTPATLAEEWRACCSGVIRLPAGLLAVLEVEKLLEIETALEA